MTFGLVSLVIVQLELPLLAEAYIVPLPFEGGCTIFLTTIGLRLGSKADQVHIDGGQNLFLPCLIQKHHSTTIETPKEPDAVTPIPSLILSFGSTRHLSDPLLDHVVVIELSTPTQRAKVVVDLLDPNLELDPSRRQVLAVVPFEQTLQLLVRRNTLHR